MSIFADPLSRGDILEPAGIIEVKSQKPDILQVMHRTDDELKTVEAEIDACAFDSDIPKLKEQIKNREDILYPVYTQVAMEFADAHDKTGRMKAKGVIKDAVEWARSHEYFNYAAKRRVLQDDFVTKMKTADPSLDTKTALDILKSMCPTDWEDNKSTIEFFTGKSSELDDKLTSMKKSAVLRISESLTVELDALK